MGLNPFCIPGFNLGIWEFCFSFMGQCKISDDRVSLELQLLILLLFIVSVIVPGSLDKKRGKTVPSFIKQRWTIDGIFLPPFLSITNPALLKVFLFG
jgi:hypothetical protein